LVLAVPLPSLACTLRGARIIIVVAVLVLVGLERRWMTTLTGLDVVIVHGMRVALSDRPSGGVLRGGNFFAQATTSLPCAIKYYKSYRLTCESS
jgi:hypothetical protein